LPIGQRGMRPDRDAMFLGELHRRAHVVEVRGVEAAGDIGEIDGRHDLRIIAEPPDAVALAHVAIDQRHPPCRLSAGDLSRNLDGLIAIVKSERMVLSISYSDIIQGMSFSLKQIRYFIAAADAGQVSQAAVELNVSQSAVTAAIQQLEGVLGVRVFD